MSNYRVVEFPDEKPYSDGIFRNFTIEKNHWLYGWVNVNHNSEFGYKWFETKEEAEKEMNDFWINRIKHKSKKIIH